MTQEPELDNGEDIDSEPHPSGLTFIQIELYDDSAEGSYTEAVPLESIGVPLRAGKHYALDGENVTADEHIRAFLDHHLSGECECLHE